MGAKQSNTNPRSRAFSNTGESPVVTSANGAGVPVTAGTSSGSDPSRVRTRSLGNPEINGHSFRIPPVVIGAAPTPGSSNPEQAPRARAISVHPNRHMQAHSLPVHLFPFNGKYLVNPIFSILVMDAGRERKSRVATLQKVQITMSYVVIKQIIKYSLSPPDGRLSGRRCRYANRRRE